MKARFCIIIYATLATTLNAAKPIQLHPDNPHYFLWRGSPTVLITSAEHYGAVLNPDFDYRTYFATLAADQLNYTRIFAGGTYVEPPGAFNIPRNTLAPKGDRYLCPWARSDQPGYTGGGNKFDLSRWDKAYFARLRDFVAEAGRNRIVVEVALFCPFYKDAQWVLSPLHPGNNVNTTPQVTRTDVYTLDKHQGLLSIQERMVQKIVGVFRDADNVFFEICNEPYFGGVTIPWQHRIADVIMEAQKDHPHQKLIAQNIANGTAQVTIPHPNVSILNFHYAAPPKAVAQNYHLKRVIGDDETGFRGTGDAPYRMEAWDFIVAGGGLYNNLDYSFVAGHENGTFVLPASAPGGGNAGFRRSMHALHDFITGFDFIHMQPNNTVLKASLPVGVTARALVITGNQYAIYLRSAKGQSIFTAADIKLGVELPAGSYIAKWINTKTGQVAKRASLRHPGGTCVLTAPAFKDDIALGLTRE